MRTSLSGPQRFRFQARSRAGRGFSLIEMIGVLAIMGILAGMLAPPIIRQLQQARTSNEEAKLEEVARAIVEGIRARGEIPNPNTAADSAGGWATISGNYTALGTNQLLYAFGTNSATQRRFYLSDELMSYFSANSILPPYITPPGGWPTNAFPANAQLVIVSSSREDFLLASPTAANISSNDFNWLKSFTKTPDTNGLIQATNINIIGTIGASPNRWTQQGQFLQTKLEDLRSLFCLVQLEDSQSPPEVLPGLPGSGYSGPGPIIVNSNGVAVSVSFTNNGSTTNFSISSVALASSPGRIPWSLTGRSASTNAPIPTNITVPGSATSSNGSFQLIFPGTPRYSVRGNPPLLLISQDTSFYVIKGTSLGLFDSSTNNTPQKTLEIQENSAFRFFNGSWSRLD